MKTKLTLLLAALVSFHAHAADDLTSALQQALFHEEADHDLAAAIKAYQFVVAGADAQRKLAATAVFRLGECYRKLGQTNEAVAQYQRVARDFADQTNLVALSSQNLDTLGVRPGSLAGSTSAARLERKRLLEEEIRLVDKELAKAKELHAQGAISESALSETQRQVLGLKRQLAALEEGLAEDHALRPGFAIDSTTGLPLTTQGLTDEEEKELKQIKAIIRDSPDLINAKAQNERSRLENAAELGQVKVAEFLLANGADVNANLGGRGAPLHRAAERGHKTMTELLLRHGAEVNNRDPGGTPLHYAVENGHRAVVEVLLANQADVNAKGNGRTVTGEMTPLHMAAFKGFTSVAELLLANGAQVNSTDKSGQTPLHYAATYLQSRVISQLLLTNKAEVNARSEDGWTPLHDAVKNNRLPVARLLLENQAEVNARIARGDFKGWTPLHFAAQSGDRAMTELLLANKAEVDAVTPTAQTPLILAANQKKSEVLEALLAAGANVNAQLENRHTALSLAVQAGDDRMVSVILARKPDLELRGENDLTVLQSAVASRKDSIAELLLRAGADPNVSYQQDGNTPLHWAVEPRRKPLVKLLLAHKASVNARNNSGRTPLDLTKSGPGFLQPPRIASDQSALDEIAALLREAGADEQMQRRSAISISRRSRDYLVPWFVQGSNTWNRFTLLELIASVYSQSPPVAFPDFARVTINRLGSTGSKSIEIAVDVEALIASDDCSKDVPLEWGDVVEIPERDRKLNENWGGLPLDVSRALKRCLDRKVEIVVKGEATKLTLEQHFTSISPQSSPQNSAFWLSSAVRGGNMLRASSDLRRVKVRRVDPATRQPEEIILNMERPNLRTDLWLKDGDVIEVPEKDPNAAATRAPAGTVAPNDSSVRPAPARRVVRPASEPK